VVDVFYDYIFNNICCSLHHILWWTIQVRACICGTSRCDQVQIAAVTLAKIVPPTRSWHVRTYEVLHPSLQINRFLQGMLLLMTQNSSTCMRSMCHESGFKNSTEFAEICQNSVVAKFLKISIVHRNSILFRQNQYCSSEIR
jgi:hypothetical protein